MMKISCYVIEFIYIYRGHDGSSKVEEDFQYSKAVMIEHEGRLRTFVPANGSKLYGLGR